MADIPSIITGTPYSLFEVTPSSPEVIAYDSGSTGTNRCLIAFIGTEFGNQGVTSITYGGQAMTLLSNVDNTISAGAYMEEFFVYYLLDPPTGVNNLSVGFTVDSNDWSAQLVTLENVDQNTPFGTPATAEYESDVGTTIDVTTTVANSSIFVGGVINGNGNGPFTMVADTTEISQGGHDATSTLGFAAYNGFRSNVSPGTYTVGATADNVFNGSPSNAIVLGVEIFGSEGGQTESTVTMSVEMDDPEVSGSLNVNHDLNITTEFESNEVSAQISVNHSVQISSEFEPISVNGSIGVIIERDLSADIVLEEIEVSADINAQYDMSLSAEFEDYSAILRIRDEIPDTSTGRHRSMNLAPLTLTI